MDSGEGRAAGEPTVLDVYLLPTSPWDEVLTLQKRLAFELGEAPRRRGALILCEHPPIITVGRQGSHRHLTLDPVELVSRRLSVRWTNRGGGCWLQMPGQLAAYAVVPLVPGPGALDHHRARLYQAMSQTIAGFGVVAQRDEELGGLVVAGREIGSIGFAVNDWVTYHGCWLNLCAPPDRFDGIQINPRAPKRQPTSLFRELRAPIRAEAVRESFLRQFLQCFGFSDYFLCHRGPALRTARRPMRVVADNS